MNDQTFTIDGYVIHVLFYRESELNEASHRGQSLIGNYSVLKHPPHTHPGEYHLHVYDGNNQIFAINKSGTAHDGFHGVRIPNKVFKELKTRFPDWNFPSNQIIESLLYTFVVNPIEKLTYMQLLSELEVIGAENNSFDRIDCSLLPDPIQGEKQKEILRTRYQELFLETYKRLT